MEKKGKLIKTTLLQVVEIRKKLHTVAIIAQIRYTFDVLIGIRL